MRVSVFFILSLAFACKHRAATTPSPVDLPEKDRLTKERILESSLEILSESKEYRIPLNKEYLSNLDEYSLEEVSLLKNSIFAQYGRKFSADWLQKYFNSRPWYKPGNYKPELLTEIDKKNAKLLSDFQTKLAETRKRRFLQYDPVGYIELGGAFAETFFHLYCPNKTYVTFDYHDLRMERGIWTKKQLALQIQLLEICVYKCLEPDPLGCEKSKLKKCYRPPLEEAIHSGALVGDEQFEEFVEEGSTGNDHDWGWHYNLTKHPLGKEPKLCNLDYKPKTYEEAFANFLSEKVTGGQ